MSRRSYAQTCPLAAALDLLGERWTLLVARDLLLGPLRFTDLLCRLPGIGRNLLSKRLQDLEGEGLVRRTQLEPPAASVVYELTDKGRGLEPALVSLAAWAMTWGVHAPPADVPLEPDTLGLALHLAFDPARAPVGGDVHEFVADGQPIVVRIADGRAEVRRGRATAPSIRLTATTGLFLDGLRARRLDVLAAERQGVLRVEGRRETIPAVLGCYGVASGDGTRPFG